MKKIAASLIVAFLLFPCMVSAEVVKFEISGHIVLVTNAFGTDTTTSSTFEGYFSYDTDSPPLHSDSVLATYSGISLSITIDDTFTCETSTPSVEVINDYPGYMEKWDRLRVNEANTSDIQTNFPTSPTGLSLQLVDSFHLAFADTSLPEFLDIDDFDGAQIQFTGPGEIRGQIETISRWDDDHDGVPYHLDTCPNTPEGIPVKPNGCVEGDYDNDDDVDGDDLALFSERFGLRPVF